MVYTETVHNQQTFTDLFCWGYMKSVSPPVTLHTQERRRKLTSRNHPEQPSDEEASQGLLLDRRPGVIGTDGPPGLVGLALPPKPTPIQPKTEPEEAESESTHPHNMNSFSVYCS